MFQYLNSVTGVVEVKKIIINLLHRNRKVKECCTWDKRVDKFAIFVSDNCAIGGARNRTHYVKSLMEYIQIDSYGTCLHNKDFPSGKSRRFHRKKANSMIDIKEAQSKDHGEYMKKLIQLISQYKFMIAFENANLTDFVTEKIILAFKAGTVPIYMGAPNINKFLPGEKSIVKYF